MTYTLAAELRQRRTRAGLTRRTVARRLGIPPAVLRAWEHHDIPLSPTDLRIWGMILDHLAVNPPPAAPTVDPSLCPRCRCVPVGWGTVACRGCWIPSLTYRTTTEAEPAWTPGDDFDDHDTRQPAWARRRKDPQ